MLQNIATKMGTRYISHDSSFHLADGQPNDGYILADGLHLNTRGSNWLVLNLGLTTTNSDVTYRNKSKIDIQNDKEKEAACLDDTSHSFWQHAKTKATRHTQRVSLPHSHSPSVTTTDNQLPHRTITDETTDRSVNTATNEGTLWKNGQHCRIRASTTHIPGAKTVENTRPW